MKRSDINMIYVGIILLQISLCLMFMRLDDHADDYKHYIHSQYVIREAYQHYDLTEDEYDKLINRLDSVYTNDLIGDYDVYEAISLLNNEE